jgi:hypothetical protein
LLIDQPPSTHWSLADDAEANAQAQQTGFAAMKPIASGAAKRCLSNITFAARGVGEQDTANNIPIVVEDQAFVSMWLPSLRERLRLALGAPVRVLVNYSVHGPLHVDTERGWGTCSLDGGSTAGSKNFFAST